MRIKDAVKSPIFPHEDAEILLAYICKKNRTWILAHGEYVLVHLEEHRWNTLRQRREQGEPVAYIIGEKEFFGRSFLVNPCVLIPRPSTEGLIEMVLEILSKKSEVRGPKSERRTLDTGIIGISKIWGKLSDIHTIVDIGTGSGCIAITLACEIPEINIIATDISTAALNIARANAKRHGVGGRIHFLQGNLLEPVIDAKDHFLLVSNPPYIPEGEKLPIDVTKYEPKIALYAGHDGLGILRPLLTTARMLPVCRGCIVECREDQVDKKSTKGENA